MSGSRGDTTKRLKLYEPTELYDAFWRFAAERQNIFMKKLNGEAPPWTDDRILGAYRFTNTYRVLDRVSQFLISSVIGAEGDYTKEDIFFRIVLFKLFNKIETWQLLERAVGGVSYSSYDFEKYDRALSSILGEGAKLYSAAYIMPSGASSFHCCRKYQNNLRLLEEIMGDDPIAKIGRMASLGDLYRFFLGYPTLGSFLAYQYAIDVNYSDLCDFSEMGFVMAGPGSVRGIEKCFSAAKKADCPRIIRLVADAQSEEFEKRHLHFQYLGDRKLQLIDIQNLFCEIDKYSRQLDGYKSDGHRIKQKYKPNPDRIVYVLPRKWRNGFFCGASYGD